MTPSALPSRAAFTVVAVIAAATGACGGGSTIAVPLPTAPEPAVAPPAQSDLPGTVPPLAGAPEGVAVIRSGVVAVSVREPNAVVLFDLSTPTQQRSVPLSGSARHLFLGGPDGPLLVPGGERDHRRARRHRFDPGGLTSAHPRSGAQHPAAGISTE